MSGEGSRVKRHRSDFTRFLYSMFDLNRKIRFATEQSVDEILRQIN